MSEHERWLVATAMGAARTMPLVWLVPVFGGPALPATVRSAFGLALATLALPHLLTFQAPANAAGWALLIAREVLVGVTLGIAASAVFRAAEAAGRLVDTVRGANVAETLDALTAERTSPLGQLYLFLSVVLFVSVGGLPQLATALARSYEAVPPALTWEGPARVGAARLAVTASAHLIEAAVGLSAPVLVAMLLADVVLGAVGRMVPQLPLFFVGMPMKALLALGVVLLGLGTLSAAITGGMGGMWGLLSRAVAG